MKDKGYVVGVLKFLVSVLVPLVISVFDPTTTFADKTLIGIGVFLSWSVIESNEYIKKINGRQTREQELWIMKGDFDPVLNNIRNHYHKLAEKSYGKDDLFLDYFRREFSALDEKLKDANEKEELQVRNYYFRSTELVLAAFDGDDSKIIRYVWILEEDKPLFEDQLWKNYFVQINKLVENGSVKEVRALLIRKTTNAEITETIKQLLGFYEFSKGYDYKIIDQITYSKLAKDERLDAKYIDFGIYGERYIYRTIEYENEILGDFGRNKETIKRYTEFFDRVYKSTASNKAPKKSLSKVPLQQLCGTNNERPLLPKGNIT